LSLRAKLASALIAALMIAVFGYGWHIRTVYNGYVASTDSGDPLFPRETLEVYNLYHGEENRLRSSLVTDTPADFLRLLRERDAGILIPHADMQNKLFDFLESPEYSKVHQADYSLISNPLDLRWQNCNELMLYAVAAVIWNTTDREVLRQHLSATITPTELKVSLLRRHYGPMIDERLILDDHGDKVQTTTFGTLTQLFEATEQLDESYVLAFKE